MFNLYWTDSAKESYNSLKNNPSEKRHYKAVKKAVNLLATNPRHHSLQTHEFKSLKGPDNEKVFEAYAEQNTPNAYRIFWYYGPKKNVIIILFIAPHP